MKAFGTIAVSYLRGRDAASVFYGEPRRKYSIVRKYVVPAYTQTNELRGKEMKNISAQWEGVQRAYKDDGILYLSRYRQQHPPSTEDKQNPNNFFAMWVSALYAWKRAEPLTVDLQEFTLADMTTAGLTTIEKLIDDSLLANVTPSADLDSTLTT